MIVSASRRTDIPSQHSEWFMEKLRQGHVTVANPRYPQQQRTVSLRPEDVDCFVFWTKNPEPLLPYLSEIDARGHKYYFQFTLTPYDKDIEQNLPSKRHLIDAFKRLSDTIGSEKVVWRYDPILLNNRYTTDLHTRAFTKLASELAPYTHRCVISFIDLYPFVLRRCTNVVRPLRGDEVNALANSFSSIATAAGIHLSTCSEGIDLSHTGIDKSSCINHSIVEAITSRPVSKARDRGQRPECRCIKSIDIGHYDSCANGCIYCYATRK